jgi:hypothetical protein
MTSSKNNSEQRASREGGKRGEKGEGEREGKR